MWVNHSSFLCKWLYSECKRSYISNSTNSKNKPPCPGVCHSGLIGRVLWCPLGFVTSMVMLYSLGNQGFSLKHAKSHIYLKRFQVIGWNLCPCWMQGLRSQTCGATAVLSFDWREVVIFSTTSSPLVFICVHTYLRLPHLLSPPNVYSEVLESLKKSISIQCCV